MNFFLQNARRHGHRHSKMHFFSCNLSLPWVVSFTEQLKPLTKHNNAAVPAVCSNANKISSLAHASKAQSFKKYTLASSMNCQLLKKIIKFIHLFNIFVSLDAKQKTAVNTEYILFLLLACGKLSYVLGKADLKEQTKILKNKSLNFIIR